MKKLLLATLLVAFSFVGMAQQKPTIAKDTIIYAEYYEGEGRSALWLYTSNNKMYTLLDFKARGFYSQLKRYPSRINAIGKKLCLTFK